MINDVGDDVTKFPAETYKYHQQIVAVVLYMSYKCLEEYNFFSRVYNGAILQKDKKVSLQS